MSGTTTNYGWTYPTSTDYVKDGATAMQTLATGIDTTSATTNLAGMVLIKSQAVGTAVSSISVTSAFSTTYDTYKIIYNGGTASGGGSAEIFGSLNGITSGYYSALSYNPYNSSTSSATVSGTIAYWKWTGTCVGEPNFIAEITNPFLSKKKFGNGIFNEVSSTGNSGIGRFFIDSTTSATGFTLTISTGTVTGGTIYVYGYRKAI